jgi:general secretion pathway protein K
MRTTSAGLGRRQRGAALLIALLVVALATVVIAGLLDRGELAAARTRNLLRNEQVEAFQLGLEAYAARVLLRDREEGEVDANGDLWSLPMPPTPVPGGTLSGTMRDLDGCFNLNNLNDERFGALWMERYRRLLTVLGLDTHIADAVKDWLDPGADPEDGGAEDNAYLAAQPPYRAANRAFAHVSELRLVRGVGGEAYARLAPYVCAVPAGSVLNLNTASVPVLRSLDDKITDAVAQRLWQRGQAHWQDLGSFAHELRNQNVELDPRAQQQLGVRSRYFVARGDIELDGLDFRTQSVIERGPGRLRVLQRGRAEE